MKAIQVSERERPSKRQFPDNRKFSILTQFARFEAKNMASPARSQQASSTRVKNRDDFCAIARPLGSHAAAIPYSSRSLFNFLPRIHLLWRAGGGRSEEPIEFKLKLEQKIVIERFFSHLQGGRFEGRGSGLEVVRECAVKIIFMCKQRLCLQ